MRIRQRRLELPDGQVVEHFTFWCPGCDDLHAIEVPGWTQTGPESFEPSILVGGTQWAEGESFHKPNHDVPAGGRITCHSFLRDGVWEFLGDCTHALAGQHVPMVDLPDWHAKDEP